MGCKDTLTLGKCIRMNLQTSWKQMDEWTSVANWIEYLKCMDEYEFCRLCTFWRKGKWDEEKIKAVRDINGKKWELRRTICWRSGSDKGKLTTTKEIGFCVKVPTICRWPGLAGIQRNSGMEVTLHFERVWKEIQAVTTSSYKWLKEIVERR